jgi:large subunit ribosomal protein L15
MKLEEILAAAGKHKKTKRLGRGNGSGQGCTAGRGHKGAGARAGAKRRYGFEGGQNPMLMRFPKRGFNNVNFARDYQVVNLATLEAKFDAGATVDAAALAEAGLIADAAKPVKILAKGELTKSLTVSADKFSAKAAQAIESAGGSATSTEVKKVQVRAKMKAKTPKVDASEQADAAESAEATGEATE